MDRFKIASALLTLALAANFQANASFFSEDFDRLTSAAPPPGWTTTNAVGPAPLWVTSGLAANADTPPNSAFVNAPGVISDKRLDTPTLRVTGPFPRLSFRQNHSLDSGFDGAVLEVSINGGAFLDVVTAGGSFVTGGYTGLISAALGSPLAGRLAWTGSSAGYTWTVIDLPGSVGQTIQLRFRMGSDQSISSVGWWVDTISVEHARTAECGTAGDFDGDLKADPTVWRASNGFWYSLKSSTNLTGVEAHEWGASGDNPLPSDFDGDWRTDMTFYRPPTGVWWSKLSSTNIQAFIGVQFGASTDIPVAGDYDGDCRTDPAVFRPSDNVWFVRKSTTSYTGLEAFVWGESTDILMPADYDGDGRTDLAAWRPSTGVWWVLNSSGHYTTFTSTQWGGDPSDLPLTGDFDGDRKADRVVFRRSTGVWWVLKSSDGTFTATQFGLATDIPVPADFNGDRITDIAVWRGSTGFWHVLGQFAVPFGLNTDVPVIGRH